MPHELSEIAAPLCAWYQVNKRPLPWRLDQDDPYRVWVSEIMLQQTRIEAVIERYDVFMRALPDLHSLAAVPEERLLKLWEGMGYYSRAKNLKKAAQMIERDFGGNFPTSFRDLRTLPGIGEYTAGAIASICFGEKVPAVDGNVLRVLARLRADSANVLLPETKKNADALLRAIMPETPGVFNEALMELGETVCLPNGLPLCTQCPLQSMCKANARSLTALLPVREKKSARKKVALSVFILQTPEGEFALEKRAQKGLLAGLYQLPNVEGHFDKSAVITAVEAWGLQVQSVARPYRKKHIFTHIEWNMDCFQVKVKAKNNRFLWCTEALMAEEYPLPTAFQKCLHTMQK